MKFLLDTHLLIWFAQGDERLPFAARTLIEDADNEIFFSAVSIWECAIKFTLNKPDFHMHPTVLHEQLFTHDFSELLLAGEEATRLVDLPSIHKDPFDRMLVAQAIAARMPLLTCDKLLIRYPNVRLV